MPGLSPRVVRPPRGLQVAGFPTNSPARPLSAACQMQAYWRYVGRAAAHGATIRSGRSLARGPASTNGAHWPTEPLSVAGEAWPAGRPQPTAHTRAIYARHRHGQMIGRRSAGRGGQGKRAGGVAKERGRGCSLPPDRASPPGQARQNSASRCWSAFYWSPTGHRREVNDSATRRWLWAARGSGVAAGWSLALAGTHNPSAVGPAHHHPSPFYHMMVGFSRPATYTGPRPPPLSMDVAHSTYCAHKQSSHTDLQGEGELSPLRNSSTPPTRLPLPMGMGSQPSTVA